MKVNIVILLVPVGSVTQKHGYCIFFKVAPGGEIRKIGSAILHMREEMFAAKCLRLPWAYNSLALTLERSSAFVKASSEGWGIKLRT